MQLILYLQQVFGWSDDLLQHIDEASTKKVYSKKQLILPPENYSRNVYFVEQGLVRMFYYKSGKNITHYFFQEGTFAAGSESTFYHKKSRYGIEAVEQTKVVIVPFPIIEKLATYSIPVNQLIQTILLQSLVGFSSRLQSIQFETAQERYQKLMEQHPDILLRAPLGDIASYLGISPQTLSVIRGHR
ncbi:Crp/Fnr family transcriptional regulator [Sphingobacterium suaedae]|uniref:Crp/Fnr family transcriptional regulator n=1 Tax=Sphingobacterium suaedae TaxID=1686402 RepID=A0ABW5KI40_9SPHI